ncbi:MAG: LPS export ABC transporter permease LptF, partial [Paracoccaceae bacterium]
MAKFDRYLLSQLVVLFGFFALVLVMIYWVNRAVVLFDQLIANGHSALVFLEFSALTLPNVIRLVLPIAAFAASVFCANRLTADSELVVVQSTGFSPYRLARPVLLFGILVGLMLSILTHVLVPASLIQLDQRRSEIETDSTARFLKEGTFLHPAAGITFYIKDIAPNGAMSSMFLSDSRNENHQISFSAKQALLVANDTGPKLIMINGMAQDLNQQEQTLTTTQFSEFVFDLGPLLEGISPRRLTPSQLPTTVLLSPSEDDVKTSGQSHAVLLQAGHERISQAVLCAVVSLIGFATLMVGGYSRFGLWRQMFAALLIFIAVKTLDNLFNDFARQDPQNWPA